MKKNNQNIANHLNEAKRYFPFSKYLSEKFGEKVYKVTLDAGFTCPNRDGTLSFDGCIFCDEMGSFSRAHSNKLSIEEQLKIGIASQRQRFKAEKFMAYFQAFTNTYKPVQELEKIYQKALEPEEIVGISIGTRPDCVDGSKLDLIASYSKDYETWIELGLQSIHDKSLNWINRGHTFKTFLQAYESAKKRNINVCVHVIIGLKDEGAKEVLQTAKALAGLGVDGVKIHSLCVLKNTKLEKIYQTENLKLLTEKDYVDRVCDFLEVLSPQTTIHRLAGSGHGDSLIAPKWINSKWRTTNLIDKELIERNSFQGKFYSL